MPIILSKSKFTVTTLLALFWATSTFAQPQPAGKKSKLEDFNPLEGNSASRIYSIGGTPTRFFYYKKNEIIISANCLTQGTKMDCEASRALRALLPETYSSFDLAGGKDFGSVACMEIFKGNLLVGKSDKGGEIGFCQFKDGSLTSYGSITSAANLKRQVLVGPKTDPASDLVEDKK